MYSKDDRRKAFIYYILKKICQWCKQQVMSKPDFYVCTRRVDTELYIFHPSLEQKYVLLHGKHHFPLALAVSLHFVLCFSSWQWVKHRVSSKDYETQSLTVHLH